MLASAAFEGWGSSVLGGVVGGLTALLVAVFVLRRTQAHERDLADTARRHEVALAVDAQHRQAAQQLAGALVDLIDAVTPSGDALPATAGVLVECRSFDRSVRVLAGDLAPEVRHLAIAANDHVRRDLEGFYQARQQFAKLHRNAKPAAGQRRAEPETTQEDIYRNGRARWVLMLTLMHLNDWRGDRRAWIDTLDVTEQKDQAQMEIWAAARSWTTVDRQEVLDTEARDRAQAAFDRARR